MKIRYWVECPDELMARSDLQWPAGLRPVGPAKDGPGWYGSRWWLFEDEGAPATLEGKRVELTFTETRRRPLLHRLLRLGKPHRKVLVISERREMP